MSRLSEILGVPEGREFKFKNCIYRINGNRRYYFSSKGEWKTGVVEDELVDMLDHPELIELIPEKLKLTEQQITAIKGRIAEGTPWAARNENCLEVNFYSDRPIKDNLPNRWGISNIHYRGYSVSELFNFVTFENSPVYLPELIEESEKE